MKPIMHNVISRISELERFYVDEVLKTQFSSSSGSIYMKKLESAFSQRYSQRHSISFVNGTATMHAALEAAGIGHGDEVLVPPLTMASTTFAVLQSNATPIFVDIDPATFQICPKDISNKITENTRAIITVAIFGGSPQLDVIREISDINNLFLLEDNAECFGATFKGLPVGCYGDAASFSFQSSKHLTAGEGGILLVRDEHIADKVRSFQSLGYAGLSAKAAKIDKRIIQQPTYKRHNSLGFNYRMPELCAAVALAQVERMDELLSPRIRIAQKYNEIASGYSDILQPQKNYEGSENTYWTWAAKLHEDISWSEFKDCLVKNGGDPFYGAWSLTYHEPFITELNCYGRENYLTDNGKRNWKVPQCPVADKIQPHLCQLQTNIFSNEHFEKQTTAFEKALNELNG